MKKKKVFSQPQSVSINVRRLDMGMWRMWRMGGRESEAEEVERTAEGACGEYP